MRRISNVMFILLLLVFLVSCNQDTLKDNSLLSDYPTLDKNTVIKKVDIIKVLDLIDKKETFSLMVGFPNCPWCQAVMPHYSKVASEVNASKVYYLDIKELRDNTSSSGRIYYLALDAFLTDAKDKDKNRVNAPTICMINNGRLVSYHLDTVESHVMNDNHILDPLTSDQVNELHSILVALFNDIL